MNIALCGIHGAMGKILKEEIEQSQENKLVGYFSPRNDIKGQDISEKIDVIIDFSRPENIDFLLDYALKNDVALVICTTGYTDEQIEKIKKVISNNPEKFENFIGFIEFDDKLIERCLMLCKAENELDIIERQMKYNIEYYRKQIEKLQKLQENLIK